MEKPLNSQKKYLIKVILCTIVTAVTFAVVMRELSFKSTDFYAHMTYAVNFRREFSKLFTSISDFPHQILYPMWHILVNLCHKIIRIFFADASPVYAAALVTALVNGYVYHLLEKSMSRAGCLGSEWAAFVLSFVIPLYYPGMVTELFYFGQGSPVIWFNPTNIMVKPFALAGFFLIKEIFENIDADKPVSRKEYISLICLIGFSVLAKPSFFQGIVPAAGLYIIIHLIRTKFAKFREYCLFCACFIPGFLIILSQYFISFYAGKGGEGVSIGWMKVASHFYPHPWTQLLLTVFFPVCYILFNFKNAVKSLEIRLSALYVMCSWLEFSLLYENGQRIYDGNFEWAVSIAYAVLWAVTTKSFFRDWQEMDLENKPEKAKNTVLFLIWTAHFVSGLYYLWRLFTAGKLYY